MNFTQLKTEVQRLTGRNDSGFLDRIEKSLNRALRQWARLLPWDGLRRTDEITHLGGRELIFPAEVDRPIWIMDTTNQRAVEAAERQWDRNNTYAYSTDRVTYAEEWELAGYSPVFTGVSGPLEIYTSDASDVVTVYFQGQALASGGTSPLGLYRIGESTNLVGTTPVTTSNSFVRIDNVVKDADTDGVLTIKSNGTAVGYIDPFERESRYARVRFMDIPVSGVTFKFGYYAKPTPLVSDYQAPDPSVEGDYLIWAAASDIFWQLREGARATAAWRRAEEIAANHMGKEKMFGDWSGRIVPEDLT